MKKLIMSLLVCIPFLMSSCNKAAPCTQNTVVTTVSNALASHWQCSNPAALQSWVDGLASKANMCTNVNSSLKTGPIASLACPLLVNALNGLASKEVPAAAGCTAVGVDVAAALTAACNLIPF